jgi:hypothetical protein
MSEKNIEENSQVDSHAGSARRTLIHRVAAPGPSVGIGSSPLVQEGPRARNCSCTCALGCGLTFLADRLCFRATTSAGTRSSIRTGAASGTV